MTIGREADDQRKGTQCEPGNEAAAAESSEAHIDEASNIRSEEGEVTRDSVVSNVLRNALYHAARQQHFSNLNRAVMFLVVLTGTAGVTSFTKHWIGSKALGAITALLAAMDLALDLRGKADLHSRLRSNYYELLANIKRTSDIKEKSVRDWHSRMILITSEEPPEFRAIDAMAYNEALDALGRDHSYRGKVPFSHRLFGHWCAFRGHDYKSNA